MGCHRDLCQRSIHVSGSEEAVADAHYHGCLKLGDFSIRPAFGYLGYVTIQQKYNVFASVMSFNRALIIITVVMSTWFPQTVDEYADYGKSDSYLIPTAKETLRQSWLASKPNVRASLNCSCYLKIHRVPCHGVAASVLVVLVHWTK